MPFFSIIIPVYNVQKYIARCLDSVVNQSFKDIEIIIIDDCGNDDSINIAKEYANKDSRIRILKNSENKGLFHTRIEGERVANGKYIMHVDSDDHIHLDACQILHQNSKYLYAPPPGGSCLVGWGDGGCGRRGVVCVDQYLAA